MKEESYEEELDRIAKQLNDEIKSLPLNGIFKIQINRFVSAEDKATTERMVYYLAEALGRPDIMVIVEGKGDLN